MDWTGLEWNGMEWLLRNDDDWEENGWTHTFEGRWKKNERDYSSATSFGFSLTPLRSSTYYSTIIKSSERRENDEQINMCMYVCMYVCITIT